MANVKKMGNNSYLTSNLGYFTLPSLLDYISPCYLPVKLGLEGNSNTTLLISLERPIISLINRVNWRMYIKPFSANLFVTLILLAVTRQTSALPKQSNAVQDNVINVQPGKDT